MNPASRDLLLHLLAAKSFRLGDFKLSSGASSDYYIDCRTTTLHAEGARLAAREFGFEVAGVLCLVEREESGGRANVEKAAAPAPFVSIFTAAQVREEHMKIQKQAGAP